MATMTAMGATGSAAMLTPRVTSRVATQSGYASPAPRLRLTARGRALLRALAAVAVLALVLLTGALFAGASGSPALAEHVAAPGESLWTIAEAIDPEGDPRVMVMRLHELNPQIGNGPLVAGQSLRVPLS